MRDVNVPESEVCVSGVSVSLCVCVCVWCLGVCCVCAGSVVAEICRVCYCVLSI